MKLRVKSPAMPPVDVWLIAWAKVIDAYFLILAGKGRGPRVGISAGVPAAHCSRGAFSFKYNNNKCLLNFINHGQSKNHNSAT